MIDLLRKSALGETACFAGFFLFKQLTNKHFRSAKGLIEPIRQMPIEGKPLSEYHMAIIADELTCVNFSKECHLHVLTPNNWKNVFQKHKIDLFLCESAWEGKKEYRQCWRGRIYKNHKVLFETRKTLFQILDYCEASHIPTVFWNKEDPTFFGNEKQDFVDTALRFQYVFTTAQECVEKYKTRGQEHAACMMFGFSTDIYNPMGSGNEKKAVFAGSWFAENPVRCQATSALFDKIINAGIPLEIYDRESESGREERRFPEEYQKYVKPAVTQKELSNIVKACQYAININTAMESETMFARRVYELMASNVYIVSNPSTAMEHQLAGRYGTLEVELPDSVEEICRKNVDYVFRFHTNRQRLTKMLEQIGLSVISPQTSICICSSTIQTVSCDSDTRVVLVQRPEDMDENCQYFLYWNQQTEPPLEKMLMHSLYLKEPCGIRITDWDLYQITEDEDNENVLFPQEMFLKIKTNRHARSKKYHV